MRIKKKKDINGFFFCTDTHVSNNQGKSADLICDLIKATNIKKVIWGGDAISAYGSQKDIDVQWHKQQLWNRKIQDVGDLYGVHGNHDFTIRLSPNSSEGFSYSKNEIATRLKSMTDPYITINDKDPLSCYYYFDDSKNRIRFIIIDSADSVKSVNSAWGNIYGVRKMQLEWIANVAIKTIPRHYDIVFVAHIPITDTTSPDYIYFDNLYKIIDAVETKTVGTVGNVSYDFSHLKTNVLLFVSGHEHYDMQTYRNGVWHVTTASDCSYNDFRRDPLLRNKNTISRTKENEPCFDCFIIEKKRISTVRVGVGGDRTFNTSPIVLKKGDQKIIKTRLKGNVFWRSYDAKGNKYENHAWKLNNSYVIVNDLGEIYGLEPGEAVLVAEDENLNREFYSIIVQ